FSVNPHATQEQNLTGLSSIIPIHTPVLLLTDVFGSTSSNICLKLVHSLGCEMVVGVNLPMILRGLCYRHEPMQTLLPRVIQAGTNSIFSIEHGATRNM
ncbi:MAG: PTS fructose transporter subunit IIA, partial [Gammaproteobacteria bacterium]|nr:PTS fructose transporter subunit IIA [Gammaproteobacteria bacterium]